jgi:diguanylate cyclase (GGDEF)-like protein/PAS domain S-box-containing protein
MRRKISPVMRLSLGLASLTVCLILSAEMLGLVPDKNQATLDARQKFCESLALQLSWSAMRNDRRAIEKTLENLIERDPDVLSASLKSNRSGTLAVIGNHDALWQPPEDGTSTPTNIQVPIFANEGRWGTLELSFVPLDPIFRLSSWTNSVYGLLFFVAIVGFFVFSIFLRRAMRELDPSRVIPGHVKAAFDALAEGVLIMDDQGLIVMANAAFAKIIGMRGEELTGRLTDQFPWYWPSSSIETMKPAEHGLPWQRALNGEGQQSRVPMTLKTYDDIVTTLIVNSSAIVDGDGIPRGVLATFDDVSELQKNNAELMRTMTSLSESKDKIKEQNEELKFLATRDPMTNCLNRRAMLETFGALFDEARLERKVLCCAMIDIDHFKSFNDRYGHAAGDKVIKYVATTITATARSEDVVARYGGEEFCLAMPGISEKKALELTDKIRKTITKNFPQVFECSRELTISIGVASISDHRDELEKIINRADDALYHSKNHGRNKVTLWEPEMIGTSEVSEGGHQEESDNDKSMLVQILQDPDETARIASLAERIMEMDTLVEETSGVMHRHHGYDELTEFPKRILFYDRIITALSAAQHESSSVGVMYVELDFDERSGDQMQPIMNDSLIAAAAKQMSSTLSLNKDDHPLSGKNHEFTVARLGNAEFGILIPEMDDPEAPTWIAKQLIDALTSPITDQGHECYINCSIGISLYPYDAQDAESLVGRASQARHLAAASQGRHGYMFYSADLNVRSYKQVKMEHELRSALANNELEVFYQPLYDIKSGEVASVEALLRWNNSDMGQVGPSMFIHIAEQTGLILEIGEWTMRQACAQAKKWVDAGVTDLRVAVNLSPVQLRVDGLYEAIHKVLKDTGLRPQNLEFEVTENAMLDDLVEANHIIQKLRASGINIAMDDFGTGFSSLSHLKKFTVDKLKIDKTFIHEVANDPCDAAVVGSMITMGKQLGMTVVAEGVEDEEQLEFLRKHECDYAQGYLMSKPLTAAKAGKLLLRQSKGTTKASKTSAKETSEA